MSSRAVGKRSAGGGSTLVDVRRLSSQLCPRFQTAVDILGRRWTSLVVMELTRGPRRFGELARRLEVVSERMLSARLKELAKEGILERRVVPGPPVQVEYALTEKGKALGAVMAAIERWADRWVELDDKGRGQRRQIRARQRQKPTEAPTL